MILENIWLKAKHWQVFVLLIVFLSIPNLLSIKEWKYEDIIAASAFLIFYLWTFTLGNSLIRRAHILKISKPRFNLFLILSMISIFLNALIGDLVGDKIFSAEYLWLMFTLGLFFFAGYYYAWLVIAQCILSIEKQKICKADFFDVVWFMIWPFTIWNFQPRINRIFK